MNSNTILEPAMSAHGIARHIGRSHQGVLDTIRRLKIPPDLELSKVSYYYPATIERIASGMRRRNGAKVQA